eukprot:7388262-Prymnesium_polylepis.1
MATERQVTAVAAACRGARARWQQCTRPRAPAPCSSPLLPRTLSLAAVAPRTRFLATPCREQRQRGRSC